MTDTHFKQHIVKHNRNNMLQSVILIVGMLVILGLIGWLFFGFKGLVVTIAIGLLFMLNAQRITPAMLTRLYGAKPVMPEQAPDLHRILTKLAERAELTSVPRLYYLPSKIMNAFATGKQNNSYLVISDGLLRALTTRELTAVMAHEVAHIMNKDIWVMGIADMFSRLTSFISTAGQLMFIFGLGLYLFNGRDIPFVGLLLLIGAPIISALLQLGLSRTREYDADLGAIELTRDPRGLASALNKLDEHHGGLMEKIILPGRKQQQPSLLRSHPDTDDRIKRILSFQEALDEAQLTPPVIADRLTRPTQLYPTRMYHQSQRIPRWHLSGLWY